MKSSNFMTNCAPNMDSQLWGKAMVCPKQLYCIVSSCPNGNVTFLVMWRAHILPQSVILIMALMPYVFHVRYHGYWCCQEEWMTQFGQKAQLVQIGAFALLHNKWLLGCEVLCIYEDSPALLHNKWLLG